MSAASPAPQQGSPACRAGAAAFPGTGLCGLLGLVAAGLVLAAQSSRRMGLRPGRSPSESRAGPCVAHRGRVGVSGLHAWAEAQTQLQAPPWTPVRGVATAVETQAWVLAHWLVLKSVKGSCLPPEGQPVGATEAQGRLRSLCGSALPSLAVRGPLGHGRRVVCSCWSQSRGSCCVNPAHSAQQRCPLRMLQGPGVGFRIFAERADTGAGRSSGPRGPALG